MTIEEAIEELLAEIKHPYSAKKMGRPDALKLGKEALERIKSLRGLPYPYVNDPLPGETKEEERR